MRTHRRLLQVLLKHIVLILKTLGRLNHSVGSLRILFCILWRSQGLAFDLALVRKVLKGAKSVISGLSEI